MNKSAAFKLGFSHGVKQAFTGRLGGGLVNTLDRLGGAGQKLLRATGGDSLKKFDSAQNTALALAKSRVAGGTRDADYLAKVIQQLHRARQQRLSKIQDTIGSVALGAGAGGLGMTLVDSLGVGQGPGRRPEELGVNARYRMGY